MKLRAIALFFVVLAVQATLTAQQQYISVDILVTATVNGTPLHMGLANYTNKRGQDFHVSVLKFYIGNVVLHADNGARHAVGGYSLVDFEDETSLQLHIDSVPENTYTSVSFIVGVDSVMSERGPQSGALDPLNGMYWTWATGYIFFKLEGTSQSSAQPKNLLTFHIGGYKAPYNNIQKIHVDVKSGGINIDIGEWIDSGAGIDFALQSSVTDARAAVDIAKRLGGSFHAR